MRTKKRIKEIVYRFKQIYGTNNPEEIIALRNINLENLTTDKEKELLQGACVRKLCNTTIYINPDLDDCVRRFTCAHELGHSVFHGHLDAYELAKNPLSVPKKYEIEADLFAAELLLDDNVFEVYHGVSFINIAQSECVPLHYVQLKFDNRD